MARWVKVGNPPPTGPTELGFLPVDARTRYVVHYAGENGGKTAHYMLRGITTTREKAPWSKTASATIGARAYCKVACRRLLRACRVRAKRIWGSAMWRPLDHMVRSCGRGIMRLFHNVPYHIRVGGHCVYVQWSKTITECTRDEVDRAHRSYLPELQKAVRATVDAPTWALISQADGESDPEYGKYAQRVRQQFIEEYRLEDRQDEVVVALYHMGMLVLSFPVKEEAHYPYYYRGIQLKPYKEAQQPSPPDS